MMQTTPIRVFAALLLLVHADVQAQQWVDGQFGYTVAQHIPFGVGVNFNLGTDTLRMDIYTPICDSPLTASRRPLLVAVHGGAFIAGDKSEVARICRRFAERGYVAVSVGYRLGMLNDEKTWTCNFPNYTCVAATDTSEWHRAFFRGVQDVKGAIRYMVNRADTYRIDPDNVFLVGESAGGFLALGAALLDTSSEKPLDAYAIPAAPKPAVFPAMSACPHNQGKTFSTDSIVRPDLGSIAGDIEQPGLPYTIRGVGNMYGAMLSDWFQQMPAGKIKPVIYQFHQSGDIVVPFEYDRALAGLSCCLWRHYGCYAIPNTPYVYGSKAISDLNTQNNYGYIVHNEFTNKPFNCLNLLAPYGCFDQINNPLHAYDNFGLREQNMASFFAPFVTTPPPLCTMVSSTGHIPPKPSLSVFPNPVTDVLNVHNRHSEPVLYQLRHAHGGLVAQGSLPAYGAQAVPMTDRPAGIYWVIVQTHAGETLAQKVVKQ